MGDVVVQDQPGKQRYEAFLGDELVGFAAYELTPGLVVFTHTEVDEAFEGRGVGGALVQGALDDVRRAGDRKVQPRCPFVASWIAEHPDYQDLVAAA